MIHGIEQHRGRSLGFNEKSEELSHIIVLEALQCPSINDKTIAPRLQWIYEPSPKGEGTYSTTSAEANHSITSIDEILQISKTR